MNKKIPNGMNQPRVPVQIPDGFTSSLFSNCHGSNCPAVVFCPCIIYGKNRARLNEIEAKNCSGDCWLCLG
jgi:hypothetical protein